MIALFTDFGLEGPYTGQVKAVLHREAPGVPVVDLFADAPTSDPKASAYLLAAYAGFPRGTVFLGVVDPGVGGDRPALVEADGRVFVGPGEGLFEIVRAARAGRACRDRLSADDVVGELPRPRPVRAGRCDDRARRRAAGRADRREPRRRADWPDDLAEIVYVDRYGNAMTGLRASALPADARLVARAARSGGREPSPTGRRARPSGTRTPTASPRSPSIAAAPTATSGSASGRRSRSLRR